MNRRKLFGVLAASPLPLIAKTEIEKPKKCYSGYSYEHLLPMWACEYIHKKHNLSQTTSVFMKGGWWIQIPGLTDSSDLACYCLDDGYKGKVIGQVKDVIEAFASACLAGEVPGVWWE